MKKIILATSILISTGIFVSISSCKKENKETLTCDSTNVSYRNTIAPLLNTSCNNCHSTANANSLGGSAKLDNYTSVFNYTDTATGSDYGPLFTQCDQGKMPKGQTKLSACNLAKIKNWIKEGAKDN